MGIRITCRQPSTGKPINVANNSVGTDWIILVEAPDFSVPDPSGSQYTARDPADPTNSRGIAAGEVFFLTPLFAKNKTVSTDWIEVRLRTEAGANNDAMGRITVPAGESVAIPLQGRSLVKRDSTSANGETLLIRAGTTNSFEVWASANEQASAEHVGVV
jgi:hypothetical protein